jgi:hypothetical protein
MTEQETLRYAQEKLFDVLNQDDFAGLYAYDREAHGAKRPAAIKRYYVGCGQQLFGNGTTWEEAVENLLVMAGKVVRA